MLTLVRDGEQAETRELVRLVASWQPLDWAAPLLAALLGMCLIVAGAYWGGLLTGLAVSLALSRYGPSWWPGRR